MTTRRWSRQYIEIPLANGDSLLNIWAFAKFVGLSKSTVQEYVNGRPRPLRIPPPQPESDPFRALVPSLTDEDVAKLSLLLAPLHTKYWLKSKVVRWHNRRLAYPPALSQTPANIRQRRYERRKRQRLLELKNDNLRTRS